MLVVIVVTRKRVTMWEKTWWPSPDRRNRAVHFGTDVLRQPHLYRVARFLQGKRLFKPFTYTRYIGNCVVFKVREEASSPRESRGPKPAGRWR
jgi:hypothetical protein